MRMKGKLDEAVQTLAFKHINIIRPGQLAGDRTEKRFGEKVGLSAMYMLNKLGLFMRYKPILANEIAQAMINASKKMQSAIYTLDEVHKLAK